MFAFLGVISIASVVYAYFGYPLIICLLRFFYKRKPAEQSLPVPGITIIIACRNEENFITDKLENTLSLKWENKTVKQLLKDPHASVQVMVASDASDDSSHSIVEAYHSLGVELISLRERQGKESAQKNALRHADHEVILFTDAKVFLEEDALLKVANYFTDPNIGAISSVDRVIDENGQSGEGAYVAYEMFVRDQESKLYSLVGLSGSCFAVRKQVTTNFPTTIPSDFCMLIETRKQGLRGVNASDVHAQYAAVHSPKKEFERKVRTVVRGMRSVWHYRKDLFQGDDKLLLFQVISHKLFRWLVPISICVSFISSFSLCFDSLFWLIVFLSHVLLFGLWFKGYLDPDSRNNIFVKICFFFVLTNYSIAVAWFKFMRGDSQITWTPSDKG